MQWQTGVAAAVPATAQGVGEVIVRDFGRFLAPRYPRRALIGVSQGAFFVDTFLAEGFNAAPGGGRAYGQALTVDGNGNWMAINRLAGAGAQDPYLRPNGRPSPLPPPAPPAEDRPHPGGRGQLHRLLPPPRGAHRREAHLPRGVHRYDWPSPHQSFAPAAVFGGFGCNAVLSDAALLPLLERVREEVPGTEPFDAHTHMGANDPDGYHCTAPELLELLGRAGSRGVVFAMHEPDGYPAANDMVLAEAAASDSVLVPFCRLDPEADPLAEAERCLAAGARGIKLHPRAEGFTLDHPALRPVFALADERRLPVLVHAGRGIPALGPPRRGGLRRLPRHAADPGPRGHLRPGLDLAAGRRAAEPLLRHRLVVPQRPSGAAGPGAARPGALGQRRARTAPPPCPPPGACGTPSRWGSTRTRCGA